MLEKLFGSNKSKGAFPPHTKPGAPPVGKQSRALKIIHAGGHAENYYMAIPAAVIIEKHPSFVLARPEIFRRPWDSVIRPDEVLVPGQKYYLVPLRTVKKLRRRIRSTTTMDPSFSTSTKNGKDSLSSIGGILVKPGLKAKARNLHVRFFGIETTNQKPGSGSGSGSGNSIPSGKKSRNKSGEKLIVKPDPMDQKKRRARIEYSWEPSLHSITE